jgi:hypothetical protein
MLTDVLLCVDGMSLSHSHSLSLSPTHSVCVCVCVCPLARPSTPFPISFCTLIITVVF